MQWQFQPLGKSKVGLKNITREITVGQSKLMMASVSLQGRMTHRPHLAMQSLPELIMGNLTLGQARVLGCAVRSNLRVNFPAVWQQGT